VTVDNFCRWSAQHSVEREAQRGTAPAARQAAAGSLAQVEIELDSTSIWSFGKNHCGQLGVGSWETDRQPPRQDVRLPRIDPAPAVPRLIKKVACGGRHTVLLSTSGEYARDPLRNPLRPLSRVLRRRRALELRGERPRPAGYGDLAPGGSRQP